VIDTKTIQKLEFDKILTLIAEYALSDSGVAEILSTAPISNVAMAQRLLDITEEMYLACHKYNASLCLSFQDTLSALKKAEAHAVLQAGELLKISRVIKAMRITKSALSATGDDVRILKEMTAPLVIHKDIEDVIDQAIASETEIKDSASDTLRLLRRKIVSSDAKLKEKLASYTRQSSVSKYLQDAIVTIRNGRFVLPVKSEFRGEVQGLIHDKSDSGATLFIEPLAVVELNNELKSLQLEEAREIERILKMLSQMVSMVAHDVAKCQKILIMLDVVRAKMLFGVYFKASKPILNDRGYVNLKKARHPLIEKNAVVPVDLSFGKDFKLLLITGPNTGGKTVCLKTAGLFAIMAASGIFLPADNTSEIAIFDTIFTDIGDTQSIVNSLSTFSSHVLNLVHIANHATKHSLVLLDELGSGTDPEEGAALALGVIEYLEKIETVGIVTTHYGALKQYAIESRYIQNVCMCFDEKTLKPTYRLIKGIPGASHALNIAATLGLNPSIIQSARKNLSQEANRLEETLAYAEKAKSEAMIELEQNEKVRIKLEQEFSALQQERQKLKEKMQLISQNAKVELRRIIGGNLEEADELIGQMKVLIKSVDEQNLFKARQIKKQLEQLQYISEVGEINEPPYHPLSLSSADIKIGAQVFAEKLGCNVMILSLPNKRGEVNIQAGSAQIKVNVSALSAIPENTFTSPNTSPKAKNMCARADTPACFSQSNNDSSSILMEVKLLGMTISEAIEVLEPHIMSAINSKNIQLKIIHGKGTGVLGKGIQKHLKSIKHIKSVRYGGHGEGETGVTFVEF